MIKSKPDNRIKLLIQFGLFNLSYLNDTIILFSMMQ